MNKKKTPSKNTARVTRSTRGRALEIDIDVSSKTGVGNSCVVAMVVVVAGADEED